MLGKTLDYGPMIPNYRLWTLDWFSVTHQMTHYRFVDETMIKAVIHKTGNVGLQDPRILAATAKTTKEKRE